MGRGEGRLGRGEGGMTWEYSEKTKQLFMDAVQGKPGTHLGEIEDADGVGQHGSIVCGDALKFTFRVLKHFQTPFRMWSSRPNT